MIRYSEIENFTAQFITSLRDVTGDNFGLYGGEMSKVFFRYGDEQQNTYLEFLSDIIESSFVFKQEISNSTFCSGSAGINWVYTYLFKNGLLEQGDYDQLCYDDERLTTSSFLLLEKGNYDFLHGAIGIAWYFLYKVDSVNKYKKYFEEFFEKLKRLMKSSNGMFYGFDFKRSSVNIGIMNLSLSHGVSSILKFCIQAYRQNVCKEIAYEIANSIIVSILKSKNVSTAYCHFPNTYGSDNADQKSRFAWCYGDLGVAFVLYQAGVAFARQDLKDLSIEVFQHGTKRKTYDQTGVMDAGFCHGASGISYMYSKIYKYTNIGSFREASNFWLDKTLRSASKTLDITADSFSKFDSTAQVYVTDYSFLEGSIGIGLVLQSFLKPVEGWDYCLMLND